MNLKYIPLLFALAAAIGACSENSKSDQAITNSPQMAETNYSVGAFHGTWVSKEYADYILKSKSPYQAQKLFDYTLVFIDSSLRSNNMLIIYDYVYGQTESGPHQHYKIKNDTLIYSHATWETMGVLDSCSSNCKMLTIDIDGKDTVLTFHQKDHKQIHLIRLPSNCSNSSVDCDIQSFISASILSGNYILLDSLKNLISDHVKIDDSGNIQGTDITNRVILWSFFREQNNVYSFDVLEFISPVKPNPYPGALHNNDSLLFQYRIHQDTILLNATSYDESEFEVSVGNTKYYLIKK